METTENSAAPGHGTGENATTVEGSTISGQENSALRLDRRAGDVEDATTLQTSAEWMEEVNNSRDQQQTGDSTWNRRRCGCSPPTVVGVDNTQLVTLRLESGKFLRFQADNGAQCHVIPLHLYKKAPDDHELANLQPERASLIAYGGSKLGVIERARIKVWRGDSPCLLDCKIMDHQEMRPSR